MTAMPDFLEMTTSLSVMNGVRYVLFCGVAWLAAYVFFRRRWLHRKIVQLFPPASDVRREIKDSAVSVLIFSLIGALTLEAARRGRRVGRDRRARDERTAPCGRSCAGRGSWS